MQLVNHQLVPGRQRKICHLPVIGGVGDDGVAGRSGDVGGIGIHAIEGLLPIEDDEQIFLAQAGPGDLPPPDALTLLRQGMG